MIPPEVAFLGGYWMIGQALGAIFCLTILEPWVYRRHRGR